jgi:VanZ family protein
VRRLTSARRAISLWAPPVLYAALIFFLSSQSSFDMLPAGLWDFDKVIHAVEYAVLALLLFRATRSPWIAFAATALYGITDELHQSFVPGRNASAYDALADALGATVACAAGTWARRRADRPQV